MPLGSGALLIVMMVCGSNVSQLELAAPEGSGGALHEVSLTNGQMRVSGPKSSQAGRCTVLNAEETCCELYGPRGDHELSISP